MTPRTLLLNAARQLKDAEIPDPQVDGALLLSHLTGRHPLELRLDADTELDEEIVTCFNALLARRLQREPLQYLTGEAEFLGRVFCVDTRVLIPRPETELLAEHAVQALKESSAPRTALDLCCGSGCLGVTLALEVEDASVTLSDLSADALAVTGANAERLGAKVTIMQGDLFEELQGQQFQLIVSNPPYIPREECDTLQPEVRREPHMALDGGDDGLDFYRRIAAEAPKHLTDGGALMLEVGWNQAQQVAELLQNAGMEDVRCEMDFQNIPRMVMARKAR